jgi:hypothetical protein
LSSPVTKHGKVRMVAPSCVVSTFMDLLSLVGICPRC